MTDTVSLEFIPLSHDDSNMFVSQGYHTGGGDCIIPTPFLLPGLLIDIPCCTQVFMLKPGLSLRSTYLAQFLLLLHRKALTLLKYIEDET